MTSQFHVILINRLKKSVAPDLCLKELSSEIYLVESVIN
jgi:hypothetical protein